jgi:prophage tail gpP-like protein
VTVTESPAGASCDAFETWAPEVDETVFDCLERAARLRGCLLVDDGDGQLVILKLDADAAAVAELTMPGNVEEATLRASAAGLYTHYEVVGQADKDKNALTDYLTSDLATLHATAQDGTLQRYRLRRVQAEGQLRPHYANGPTDEGGAMERARWEAATRAGRATLYTCTVGSWRIEEGGDLWAPGMLVHVADTYQGIDANLLLVDVSYRYGPDGTRADLSLAPPAGYLLESPAEYVARKKIKAGTVQQGNGLWLVRDPTTGALVAP